MTYAEALACLGETRRFGMKLGLEPMRQLAATLGHPEKELRFIHLAGTNGKGSTAAFCESCLRTAGFRVGLYTSPHLVSVRERVQINREPISETDFAKGIEAVHEAIAASEEKASTFFEMMTGLALWYFARERVDWVVWETGLGGRLDATNIVDPEVCIITNIGLDHQQYLGETLEEIAAEKAGIIKEGVPVVSAVKDSEAAAIIEQTAASKTSQVVRISRDFSAQDLGLREGKQRAHLHGEENTLGLIGGHQVENAACAVAALRLLPGVNISHDAIARGLANTNWPGRFDLISESPLIVLDGAHNEAGTARLVETWRAFLKSRKVEHRKTHLVFASVADKDITTTARLLAPLASRISFVRLGHERGDDPRRMADFFPGVPHVIYESVSDLWGSSLNACEDFPTLITGSLFLVGEVLAQKQGAAGEYQLNERLVASR